MDPYYSVCAMPNTYSIFVYSSPLLFSHRIDEKDTHIKHIAFGRHRGIHTHTHTHTHTHMLRSKTHRSDLSDADGTAASLHCQNVNIFCSLSAQDKPSWQQVSLHVSAHWPNTHTHTHTHTHIHTHTYNALCTAVSLLDLLKDVNSHIIHSRANSLANIQPSHSVCIHTLKQSSTILSLCFYEHMVKSGVYWSEGMNHVSVCFGTELCLEGHHNSARGS